MLSSPYLLLPSAPCRHVSGASSALDGEPNLAARCTLDRECRPLRYLLRSPSHVSLRKLRLRELSDVQAGPSFESSPSHTWGEFAALRGTLPESSPREPLMPFLNRSSYGENLPLPLLGGQRASPPRLTVTRGPDRSLAVPTNSSRTSSSSAYLRHVLSRRCSKGRARMSAAITCSHSACLHVLLPVFNVQSIRRQRRHTALSATSSMPRNSAADLSQTESAFYRGPKIPLLSLLCLKPCIQGFLRTCGGLPLRRPSANPTHRPLLDILRSTLFLPATVYVHLSADRLSVHCLSLMQCNTQLRRHVDLSLPLPCRWTPSEGA